MDLQRFYQVQTPTLCALSRDPVLQFVLGHIHDDDDAKTVRHIPLPLHPQASDIAALRGSQDRAAVFARYAWPEHVGCAARYGTSPAWHRALEQLRCEAHAARFLAGVRENLRAFYVQLTPSVFAAKQSAADDWVTYIRQCLLGCPLPVDPDMAIRIDIKTLSQHIDNPYLFHQTAAEFFHRYLGAVMEAIDAHRPKPQPVPEGENVLQRYRQIDLLGETVAAAVSALRHNPEVQAGYRVFSTADDEEYSARRFVNADQHRVLRSRLDEARRSAAPQLAKLAARLRNALYASESLDWQYEFEDGEIDTARLDRLIADPTYRYAYRRTRRRDHMNTALTLLIDNSGSMRGRPITVAAVCTDLIAHILERCGSSVEILGYTTADWNGGAVRRRWTEQGKPARPGRLNALRHIVYKSAQQSWRRTRNNIAVMLQDDLLKENIDGEAVQWAWSRLLRQPHARKLLLVISDGAPSDQATQQANGSRLLEQHLHEVIRSIERDGAVELLAIGIGHDVSAYYPRAVTIPTEEQLGEVLVEQLCRLFEQGRAPRIMQPRGGINTGYAALM